ncbi:MAG: indolepyruvate ferredoxin oxidoreductase subunit alpha [Nitrososphaerales archaeon]
MSLRSLSGRKEGEKVLLMGNEAIAWGAVEGGVAVAAGYPGTPSSEIIDSLAEVAGEHNIYVEWSTNEKVALEVALAASYCKLRSMTSMKHVGLNVAHDSFMTAAHIGARGGFVVVSCDDPGAWSSQNEQDNRYIAMQAYVPVFEPYTPDEAKKMMVYAFQYSEDYGQPVMLRSTTRVSHATSEVELGVVQNLERKPVWEKRPDLLVYDSAGARRNRVEMVKRFERIVREVDKVPFNKLMLVDGSKKGIVASGLAYGYVKEALNLLNLDDKVSLLKLGMTYPIPKGLIKNLLDSVEELLVVEELEPIAENLIKAYAADQGYKIRFHGKDLIPLIGELTTKPVVQALTKFLGVESPIDYDEVSRLSEAAARLPPTRPPVLCPGCPHRASYFSLKKVSTRVANNPKRFGLEQVFGESTSPIYPGDIGCYGLAYLPPFKAIDLAISMGGGLGFANGLAHIVKAPIVVSIGDSTFFHAGIPALINAVHHKARMVIVILDNDVTAMTGEQPTPGSAVNALGQPAPRVMLEDLARGCGVSYVQVVDPSDFKRSQEVLEEAMKVDGPAVVIFRRPCELVRTREQRRQGILPEPYMVNQAKCTKCMVCITSFGCPAIYKQGNLIQIDPTLCTGCGDCAQICPHDAFVQAKALVKTT